MLKVRRSLVALSFFVSLLGVTNAPAIAVSVTPQVAADQMEGYDRSLFKHWIDSNKNGCNTRAEVLISEAIVKPKIGKGCKLTGGKWFSAYDGKTVTNASKLDVDHLVPLAEAWRSGAWAWTAAQRQAYANDLDDSRALIAVTLSTNRSKSDKDVANWLPKKDVCGYVANWIVIKLRYSLTYDDREAAAVQRFFNTCKFGDLKVSVLPGFSYQTNQSAPKPSATPTPSATEATSYPLITAGAFCAPAGAKGQSAKGVIYTCKTSPTDTRNRWRQ
jgi:hypothetical protein